MQAAGGRLALVEDKFSNLQAVARNCGHDAVDGIVFDLGVSSLQLDQSERGFSFRHDGPLDMRMGRDGPTAADLLASASERDLASIIRTLGEERHARSIARAIVTARREQRRSAPPERWPRSSAGIVHARPGAIHPATRTFQALRIFVNRGACRAGGRPGSGGSVLRAGGRLVAVAFHSLEDRIVKSFLADRGRRSGGSRHVPETVQAAPTFRVLTKRPIVPDAAEVGANPRARSAKLRAAERTDEPPRASLPGALVPRLPSLSEIRDRPPSGRRASGRQR